MHKLMISIALAATAAVPTAMAQTPHGTYTWQVSTNGTDWTSEASVGNFQSVQVRLLGGWTGVTGTDIGYAGSQFDAIITNGHLDTITDIVRPDPFAFAAQLLVARSYVNGMKIDTNLDTSLPGAGTGWVNPGQASAATAVPGTYNSDNPAVLFTYTITLGFGNLDRTVGMVLSNTTGRAMAIFTNANGTNLRLSTPDVSVNQAIIHVPAPGGAISLGLAGLCAGRRTRRSSRL